MTIQTELSDSYCKHRLPTRRKLKTPNLASAHSRPFFTFPEAGMAAPKGLTGPVVTSEFRGGCGLGGFVLTGLN